MAAAPGRPNVAGPVRVFVRLRPPAERQTIEMFEISPERQGVVTIKDPLSSGRREHSFEFNMVFNEETSQDQLFMPVAGSGCVIAYGQTGSGKTYSIFGEDESPTERGLLPRAMERLLHGCAQKASRDGEELDGITVSFLEVYMDQVRDLGFGSSMEDQATEDATPRRSSSGGLAKDDGGEPAVQRRPKLRRFATQGSIADRDQGGQNLVLRETPDGSIQVQGLAQLKVRDLADVSRIVRAGLARRATALTESNVRSSRSHTVFTVQLPVTTADGVPTQLSFVDLAGSERLAKSKAEGQQFQEAMAINTSLTALGKVVLALASDPKVVRHVPYRDSKLTRILSTSLRTQVSILATIHPRVEDYEESLNTLSFADRCKNVARQPQVKYVTASGTQKAKIADLQRQVADLKEKLREVHASRKAAKTDDVDDAIAQALALAAAPSAGGMRTESMATDVSASGGGDGARRAADNPQLNMLMKLQDQRKQQGQAIQKCHAKLEELSKKKQELLQSDPRDTEVINLENRRNEMKLELTKLQEKMDEFVKEKAKNFPEQLDRILNSSDLDDGNIIFKGHDALVQGQAIAPRIANALEDGQKDIEDQGKEGLQDLVKRQTEELKEAKDGLTATLKTKCETNLNLIEEYESIRLAEEAGLKAAQDELDSLYSLVFRLVNLISDTEEGAYPVMRCRREAIQGILEQATPSLIL
ncbi:KIF21B [Symbiodinium sp. CCMP2456]|nr:KIF21B [Symbiodinium sp. CCMP2456]